MKVQSLRFRLLSWYALWLAIIFVIMGGWIYFALENYLERTLATSQRLRAQRLVLLLPQILANPRGELAADIKTDFAPEASGRLIRVFQTEGKIIYQSGRPHDQSFDPAQISLPRPQAGTHREKLADGSEFVRTTVAAESGPAAGYFVETGESFSPALKELHSLLVLLAVSAAAVAVVTLAGGWVLVGRALSPVGEITRRAEGVTSRNLSERLPVPATGDELEHLTQALNRMIHRMDEALQHNRRFLADASHELRTPLTILRGELEAMVRRDDVGPDFREDIGSLLEEVERLAHLVENLFALSRLDAGLEKNEHETFDLAKLVSATTEQMCLLAKDKDLTVVCRAEKPVMIEGGRARIKQVIVNLLDNAIKYTPAGGTITLTVRAQDQMAICEVADNGIGIPSEAIPRVFDRFFRVDTARSRDLGGAGIGLSIVKAICLAQGGGVEVESAPGSGSTFRVHLPLAQAGPFNSSAL